VAKLKKTVTSGFEAKLPETVTAGFEAKPLETVTAGFEAKSLETKKPTILVSMCMVQTAHGATRPLDRPATEYPTCASILGPLHQVSYSGQNHHRCMPCRTCHLHTMRQANTILHLKQR
jgi:hypothetical protein